MKKLLPLVPASLLLLLSLSTACGPAPGEGEGEGEGELDVAGSWSEDYSCVQSCPGAADETLTGTVDMTLTQDGTSVTREDGDGTEWTGTLTGNVLELSTSDTDYSEDSTFTFDDGATSFTVESTYTYLDCTGTCTGTGERQ